MGTWLFHAYAEALTPVLRAQACLYLCRRSMASVDCGASMATGVTGAHAWRSSNVHPRRPAAASSLGCACKCGRCQCPPSIRPAACMQAKLDQLKAEIESLVHAVTMLALSQRGSTHGRPSQQPPMSWRGGGGAHARYQPPALGCGCRDQHTAAMAAQLAPEAGCD